jgi:hypothetical protein
VIDDEAETRLRAGGPQGGGELPGANEQVVGEARIGELSQPVLHLVPQEPVPIVLVMNLVAHADEVVPALTVPQVGDDGADSGAGEVDPADDPGHEVGPGGDLQEVAGLVCRRGRLHDDRFIDPALREE